MSVDDTAVAQLRAGAVDDGAPEVRERVLGVTQPVPAAVDGNEGVLYELLGPAVVVDQQERESYQTGVMGRVELADRLVGVAVAHLATSSGCGPPPALAHRVDCRHAQVTR